MAHINNKLTSIDFDGLKTAMIEHLQSQSQFTDYNFDGSGLSVLINLLAFDTSQNAFMANMLGNEMWLDSASRRSSVVSRAKLLGYTPSSVTSPTATIDLTINASSGTSEINISKNTQFTTVIDNTTYIFSPDKAYPTTKTNLLFTVTDMNLKGGTWQTFSYVVNTQDSDQRFIISNNKADMSTLSVVVRKSINETSQEVYVKANGLAALSGVSKVYWLQEVDGGSFEVIFGDGVIGKRPQDGNVITVEYISTEGAVSNFASTFTLNQTIAGDSSGVITTKSVSSGGSPPESIESIKFLAPKNYQAQSRAVTTNDYESAILSRFPFIQSVSVWGGEDGDPTKDNNTPVYGKVFISIKPSSGFTVTTAIENDVIKFLASRNIVSVIPSIIDPEYLFITINSLISYDSTITSLGSVDVTNIVKSTIENFSNVQLDSFKAPLRLSKLSKNIDDSEGSILSNQTSISMKRKIQPVLGVKSKYSIKFGNSIYHPVSTNIPEIKTTEFTYFDENFNTNVSAQLEDNNGIIRIYTYANGEKVDVVSNIGTVDYTTGEIILVDFNPLGISGEFLEITAKPKNSDVFPLKNTILFINTNDITVNASSIV